VFIPAVTPGQIAFNFPNRYYPSHQKYFEAAAAAMAPEYKAIVNAGATMSVGEITVDRTIRMSR
jgi:5-methyltetrahydropteroyltriglutamate--homocysteine methyltransferase